MARAMNRLRKQVAGRRTTPEGGYAGLNTRVLSLETTVLEMLSYQIKQMGAQGDDPDANALVEAANNFRGILQKVVS